MLLLAPSPTTLTIPSASSPLTASANSAPSTSILPPSFSCLSTSDHRTPLPPPRPPSSSTTLKTSLFRSSRSRLSLALVPSVNNPMSISPVRASVAACFSADRINRTASSTSLARTSLDKRMRACASARRIMDSSWRVVAVMRRFAERMSSPSFRMPT
ncbi:hypothetical protein I7I48_08662 [Histoplasma ohiense]|nr:hypothetical protein I7I48_08662 [Histoplasma ohiense (nom. inval.)]